MEGYCGGDGDGFTVGLRRWLRIWVRFVLCCSGSVGLWVLRWVYGWLVVAVCFWSNLVVDLVFVAECGWVLVEGVVWVCPRDTEKGEEKRKMGEKREELNFFIYYLLFSS